jgi:hypothetical protein
MGEDEEQHGDEGCEESKKFPAADFCSRCHRWIECIAQPDCRGCAGCDLVVVVSLHPTHRKRRDGWGTRAFVAG